MKIVLLDGYTLNPGDLDWTPLERFGEVVLHDRTAPDEVAERIKDADIVISCKIMWNEAAFEAAPNLKFIALASTGYNVVDLGAATRHKVIVSNVPAYSTPDVAQMVFALMLEFCFHVGAHSHGVAEGEWIRSPDFCYWNYPLIELQGKTLGIIGMGAIGHSVARIADAFDMNVLFHNRSPKPECERDNCRQVSFEEVVQAADFLSLHVPETPETINMIDRKALSLMKQGAFLINTARGTLVDEHALADALNSGKLAGAGVDVLAREPMLADNPLLGAKNIFITPHIAWATQEARSRLLDMVVNNIAGFISGNPRNVIN